jgi:hypothetical protein
LLPISEGAAVLEGICFIILRRHVFDPVEIRDGHLRVEAFDALDVVFVRMRGDHPCCAQMHRAYGFQRRR